MIEAVFYLSITATFSIIFKRYSKNIFILTSRLSKNKIAKPVFNFLTTISHHPFKWFVTGKAIQEIGSKTKQKPIEILGKSLAIPTAFIMAHRYRLPIASKAIQGFLITIKPFEGIHSILTNQTLNDNSYKALSKSFKWGVRDLWEISLPPEYKIANKFIGVLLTEQKLNLAIKTILRENHEQSMSQLWEIECPSLDKQIPYVVSNAIYSISLDPLFDYLNELERISIDFVINYSIGNNSTVSGELEATQIAP